MATAARSHPGVTRGASGDAADGSARCGCLGDSPGITGFVPFAANLALLAIELARFRVDAPQPGAKISGDTVWQGQGIKPEEQLAFAFYTS